MLKAIQRKSAASNTPQDDEKKKLLALLGHDPYYGLLLGDKKDSKWTSKQLADGTFDLGYNGEKFPNFEFEPHAY